MRVLEAGAYLAEGSGCSLLQSDWRCSLWPVTVREKISTRVLRRRSGTTVPRPGSRGTYRQRRVFVQQVFGSDAKAGVVTAGGPGQSHRRLQLVVDLLVDGAAELGAVVPEGGEDPDSSSHPSPLVSHRHSSLNSNSCSRE